ncbi:MAG: hypothetical protein COU07_00275 [Candidatus Harrisonbacteria bacterium CG10_big_fil_rev_8_21_14_0_10_40_38]|uniref:Response regulatory domain-containing protein n=1 Tax=Candidatus Harrisonbacteria bacterium CG10_big_fil_rev_8_21_14_0_10_40_38 TaxID=1974583 RepID=A0A2H0USD7_9BACT|nr:MAG: hypothetical protein COU07_00275 [Candidatus Harrisonbacteria bacterium CG10_big_fil_rev_8_21_14_0_10_40_38]
MPKTKNILILEDDIETLSKLLEEISKLEEEIYPDDIDVTVLSNYKSVEKWINKEESEKYDIILLDRDCKMGGSFHILDIEKFGPDKIISISSTPQWNEEAKKRGIKTIVWKNYENLDAFAKDVGITIRENFL